MTGLITVSVAASTLIVVAIIGLHRKKLWSCDMIRSGRLGILLLRVLMLLLLGVLVAVVSIGLLQE